MVFQKRGLEHVEAILSFLIFVGFLVFALFFFNPLDTTRVLDSSLSYSFTEVSKNISVDSERYTLIVNETIPNLIKVIINPSQEEFDSDGVRVENVNGAKLSASYLGGTGDVLIDRQAETVMDVSFGEGYITNDVINGANLINPENYTIASSEIKESFSETKINDLKTAYDTNYAGLKEQFNIPARVDFSFMMVFEDGSKIVADIGVPENVEVFSSRERKEIIRIGGRSEYADLFVKVW